MRANNDKGKKECGHSEAHIKWREDLRLDSLPLFKNIILEERLLGVRQTGFGFYCIIY